MNAAEIESRPLTVELTRELLGAEAEGKSDEEVRLIRDRMRGIARLINSQFDWQRTHRRSSAGNDR